MKGCTTLLTLKEMQFKTDKKLPWIYRRAKTEQEQEMKTELRCVMFLYKLPVLSATIMYCKHVQIKIKVKKNKYKNIRCREQLKLSNIAGRKAR